MPAVAELRPSGLVVIGVSFVLAMILSIMPLPDAAPPELGYFRPDWVALVLIYWIIALPHRVGLLTAWSVGLLQDVLLGSLLGQHALALVVIVFVASSLYQRLRMFSVWQQALIVFAMLGLNQLVNYWISNLTDRVEWSLWILLPGLSGALIWPFVFLLLRSLRRWSGVK